MGRILKQKWLSLCLALFIVFSLAGSTALIGYGAEPAKETSQAAGESDIVVLFTNDVHCDIEDNIGYGGLSLYKKQMQAQTPYVSLIDAGDAIQGAPIGTLSDGSYIIDIMNQIGYDFAIPGNHEFDYGMANFLNLSKALNCGYYSCNFLDTRTNELVFEPYKIISYGNTKVAYVGVTTPESFTKSTPAYFQDGNGNYCYSFFEDATGSRLYAQVQKNVDAARKEGADYVILTAHLGTHGVTPAWSSQAVIANTNGIDACIDGHSHEQIIHSLVSNKSGAQVPVVQTGSKLASIGKLTIKPDGSITTELIKEVPPTQSFREYTVQKGDTLQKIAKRELGSYTRWAQIYQCNTDILTDTKALVPGLLLHIPEGSVQTQNGQNVDSDMEFFLSGIKSQYEASLSAVIGFTPYLLTTADANGERAVRKQETNLGNLTADAYRNVLDADVGFSNGGGIRADISPGNITYNDTLSVFPFGNMGCVVEATGAQILDLLEMSYRQYPEESGSFLHVSGLTFTIDSSIPSGVLLDAQGSFAAVDGERRISDVMIQGKAIDPDGTYTVASHNYLLKNGGDGMNMFVNCPILKDEVMSDVDILSTYIQSLGGSVPSDYENPAGQNRITIR